MHALLYNLLSAYSLSNSPRLNFQSEFESFLEEQTDENIGPKTGIISLWLEILIV